MTFRPTLAVNADISKLQYPLYASPKLDGIRCSIVNGKALSRTLKPIPNRYISACLSHPVLEGLDGELIIGEPTSKTCYTSSVSGVMRHDGVPRFTYYVFDLHTAGGPFTDRLAVLRNLTATIPGQAYICLLEQTLLTNEEYMLEYEAYCVGAGYEGLILRSPNAPYKFGRSTMKEQYLMKLKRFADSDAQIIGFEEEQFNGNTAEINELGRTKRSTHKSGLVGKKTLGAFKVRDLVTGIVFSIGTGLTAAQRQEYWNNQDKYLGEFIKYKHFEVGAKIAPRHPVFLGFRDPIDI